MSRVTQPSLPSSQSERGGTGWDCSAILECALTITADCGGSNGARVRLWKVELQKFADDTDLTVHVHHFLPGTAKWNKIEHRLFCHITQNWGGKPLRVAIVKLIGATTTKSGLLDTRSYKKASRSPPPEWQNWR